MGLRKTKGGNMCRFLGYKGAPIVMDHLLYQPKNSLIHQSYHALERRDPVNGDGFGVGWYAPGISPTPALFVSIRPAWNNRNLRYLAPKIRSGCIFAHVRAAGTGAVTEPNCHPFHYGNFLMMHNGNINNFLQIKRELRNRLSDETYNWITGETDSEHFFALFLDYLLREKQTRHDHNDMTAALQYALAELKDIHRRKNAVDSTVLNLLVTNGKCMVAMRYSNDPAIEAPTLYHSIGSRFECSNGVCRMKQTDPSEHAVLIVSEKLTDAEDDWHCVPTGHIIVVKEDLSISLIPIPG